MIASKENAEKALEKVTAINAADHNASQEHFDFLTEFLKAAVKKLPRAASYAKESERRRRYYEGRKAKATA